VASANRIDINTARVEDLVGLPMIGEARARAIVEHRNQNGQFTSVDKLREVKGVGPATLIGIRNFVTVRTADALLMREPAQPQSVVKSEVPLAPAGASRGRVEIVLANGRHLIVDTGIDVAVLARLIAALEKP
jgi:competence ComEA-like helix-hairpin-helix protein